MVITTLNREVLKWPGTVSYTHLDVYKRQHRYCAQQNRKLTRIDPEIVTSNVLGLQIAYHKLSRFGHVLGLTCMLPVAIQVFDDVEHPVYAPLDGRTVFVD